MKTNTFRLLGLLLILVFTVGFIACSDDDEDEDYPYTHIKGGGLFYRGNTVRFYYIDEEGKDLLDPEDMSSLPVSYDKDEKLPEVKIIPDDYKDGLYNRNHNSILFDPELKLYYMNTSAPGNMEKPTYTFYIGYKDDFDKMDLTYRYTDKNVDGGKYHSKIISWKFNGTYIYSDNDSSDKKVFIKKANGKTTVSLSK